MPKKDESKNLKNSKLVVLLSPLEVPLVKQFKAWMKRQGKSDRDSFLVITYLLKFHPTFEDRYLQQEVAFQKIFGKKPFDYRRLMKAVSQAHLELKQFLIQQELKVDGFLVDSLLAKVYTKYQLRHELDLLLDKKKKPLMESKNPQEFYEQLKWNHIHFSYSIKNKLNENIIDLTAADVNLDYYYAGLKLRYLCEMLSQKQITNRAYRSNFDNELLLLCEHQYEDLPNYHRLYYLSYLLIKNPEDRTYDKLNHFFKESWETVNSEDQIIIFSYLTNFTTIRIRQNKKEYLEEAFELYKFGFEKEILAINEAFPEEHLLNFVSISSYAGDTQWAKDFIMHKKVSIQRFLSDSVYFFSLARLAFAQGKWQECKTKLTKVDYKNYSHFFRAKILEIACAYELQERMDYIESLCKSFENYCRRNADAGKKIGKDEDDLEKETKIMHQLSNETKKRKVTMEGQQKARYTQNNKAGLNFVSAVRQLNRLNSNKEKLKNKIASFDLIVFQNWLYEKVENLQ